MFAVLGSFAAAVGQCGDKRFRRVIVWSMMLALALLSVAYALFLMLLKWAEGDGFSLPLIGEARWLSDLLSWGSFALMLLFSVFLMIPVASAITSLFLDEVAQAVEDRHYPHLPPARRVGLAESASDTVSFLGLLVVANLFAFFLYAMMPPLSPLIFWGLNGFLLGREYFQLAAMRRVGRDGARGLRKRHWPVIWLAGVLMAVPLSFPLINLIIPVLGAATFTHLFHRLTTPDVRSNPDRSR